MTMSVSDRVEYKEFAIVPYPAGSSFKARIRRKDGLTINVDQISNEFFDTMECPTKEAAVAQAKLNIDLDIKI